MDMDSFHVSVRMDIEDAVCGPDTDSRSAKSGNKLDVNQIVHESKIVFGGSKRWTRRNHPYRRNLEFNGKEEFKGAPVRMASEETIRCTEGRAAFLTEGRRVNSKDNPIYVHGMKRKSILFELPYWQMRPTQT
jgi:hypothetical protein